jgi:hypothetical protein
LTKNEVLIDELDVTGKADFMDGYHHQVLIQYTSQEELHITLVDATKHHRQALNGQIDPLMQISLKLSDYI